MRSRRISLTSRIYHEDILIIYVLSVVWTVEHLILINNCNQIYYYQAQLLRLAKEVQFAFSN